MVRDNVSPRARTAARSKARIDRPFRRAARALWDNLSEPAFSADVLRYGVCGGCSLGSDGLSDPVLHGVHLCGLRLAGLRRWTRAALELERLPDHQRLSAMDRRALEELGRCAVPLLHRRGLDRLEVLGWEDALKLATRRLEGAGGRWSLLCDDHSSSNETLFALSQLAHGQGAQQVGLKGSPRTAAALDVLEEHLGHAAGTTSLAALNEADLVVLWGSVLEGHPVLAKMLVTARSGGTRVVAVHAESQQQSETLVLPSRLALAPIPSRAVDQSYALSGASEAQQAWDLLLGLVGTGSIDSDYLATRTDGWPRPGGSEEELASSLLASSHGSAAPVSMDLLRELSRASRAVIVVGDGMPCSAEGHRSLVRALTAICLLRGWLGRSGAGILVAGGGAASQGARDLGLGSSPIDEGFSLAGDGDAKLVYCVGDGTAGAGPGGYEEVSGFGAVPTRIHQACYLDPSMFVGDAEEVLVLPVQSRFEQRGGSSATSLDRRVRFGPEIQGHPVGALRPDWQIPLEILRGLRGPTAIDSALPDVVALREAMASAQPRYAPLVDLRQSGDGFQWGGETLYESRFATHDGRAHLPWPAIAEGGRS